MLWKEWPRVILELAPTETFDHAMWLEAYGATYKWTTGNSGQDIVTAFYIQDPQIAVLFKLTHVIKMVSDISG